MPKLSHYANAVAQLARHRFCKACQQPYRATAGHQKYCSARCRQVAYRHRRSTHTRQCPVCLKHWLATPGGRTSRSYYCSRACQQKAYRARHPGRKKVATLWGFYIDGKL